MIAPAVLSALHLLTLALGLGAIVWRLRASGRVSSDGWDDVLRADTMWGIAAALWIATGLGRVFFGGRETAFYTHNVFFWIKMTLFVVVFAIELRPMTALLRVRRELRQGRGVPPGVAAGVQRASRVEIALVVAIVFVAAFMARGAWMF